jgi:predicted house-cleaning noncanonical NTP pyrophosphatase (MazG superfamily)
VDAPSTELTPISNIFMVDVDSVTIISPEDITISSVGYKAFGLSALPAQWTLPFYVISQKLLRVAQTEGIGIAVDRWIRTIESATQMVGIAAQDNIHLRSSGPGEGLSSSGRFFTMPTNAGRLKQGLEDYLKATCEDHDIRDEEIFIIVQLSAISSSKGHLSNERRCYKEARDWLGQVESELNPENFSVNLRNWREEINVGEHTQRGLYCNLQMSIQKTLRFAAAWGCAQKKRLHFEWVWNGKQIYLVQVEEERGDGGDYNPLEFAKVYEPPSSMSFRPEILLNISPDHAKKYAKVHNVYVYMGLGLPTTGLYVLDNQRLIGEVATGTFPGGLIRDLVHLTSRPLIIRTDLDSSEQSVRQMLPRTEVHSVAEAKTWLQEKTQFILSKNSDSDIAFIFHNFIPAQSAVFAYAAPSTRKVQMEALWGIPEGLYYNTHDKFVVDTMNSDLEKSRRGMETFKIHSNIKYKPFCVAPDAGGSWEMQSIKRPYDWKSSVAEEKWLRQMALQSREIAEVENKGVSIMWFVGVPEWAASDAVLPWFHEPFSIKKVPRTKNRRNKTPFDRCYEIRTAQDIENFRTEVENDSQRIRQILIRPTEESLLRDKFTLKTIGELSKKIGAVILLEGATLSHAFYQLIDVGAIVHVESPFQDDVEAVSFNKLVRDNIPERIQNSGELVTTKTLTGGDLVRALREKLVEEAIEVLDATNHDSVVEELADLSEVVDGLKAALVISDDEIEQIKIEKRAKAGGFEQGLVLVETSNPSPSASFGEGPNLELELNEPNEGFLQSNLTHSESIRKRTDIRSHTASTELLLTLDMPLTLDRWDAESREIGGGVVGGNQVKAVIQGQRSGAHTRIELSIYTTPIQLDLLAD